MTRFAREVHKALFRQADAAARSRGSATLEAEHLLLALATRRDATAKLLFDHGLTPEGIERALQQEFETSLGVAGVRLEDHPLPDPPRRSRRGPRVAASTNKALERAFLHAKEHSIKRITSPVLLAGILQAEVGTVPRALAAAGIERDELRAEAEFLASA